MLVLKNEESEGGVWLRFCLYVMAGFPRILKNPCASKENRFPKLNLPTVYQRNRRAKLAVNTQTPVHGRFCHRTGVRLLFYDFCSALMAEVTTSLKLSSAFAAETSTLA